jgi:ABC-2 type transport system permease protein
MTGLVKNEVMKIFCRRLTKILLLVLCIFSIASSFVYKSSNQPVEDWRAAAEETVTRNQNRLDLVELSPQLKADAENKLAIAEYRLEHDIPEPATNAISALLNTSGLIETIIIIVLIIAAEIVSREYNDGTMKLLLIRPHKRTKILLSKYIAVVFLGIVALLIMVLSAGITNFLLYGFGDLHATDLFINQQGEIVQLSLLSQTVKLYLTSIFSVLSYATIAFAISTILRNSALAVGGALVLMICGNMMIESTSKIGWLKYLPFANSDMSLYIYHLQPRPEMTMGFSIAVLVAYMIVLLMVSMVVFQKRDVSI